MMNWNFWAALTAVLIVIAVAGTIRELGLPRGPAPTPPVPSALPPQPQASQPAGAIPAPSFDAVHIGQDGNAVVAGRAAPGAQVTVLDRGRPVASAKADGNGEWVAMTQQPLVPGPQELTLSARAATGEERHSAASVAIVVPQHGEAQPPVAVLLPPEGAAQAAGERDARPPRHLTLDIVEFDPAGRTILSGRADPGVSIAVSVNDSRLATAKAGGNGEWSEALASGVPVGRFFLRLKGQAADGSDAGDVALEIRRASLAELGPGGAYAIVPGNNLWHLARRSYGDGLRYVEIYRANQAKIEDPNRIYPGQLLTLPDKS